MPRLELPLNRLSTSSVKAAFRTDRGLVLYAIGWVWFACCFLFLCNFMRLHSVTYIDSDASAQLILAELLNRTGGLATTEWLYSTGVSFFGTHLVFSPLFLLFPRWRHVRVVGTVVILVLYLIAFYALCNSLKLRRLFPWIASVLVVPVGFNYAEYVLLKPFYALTICYSAAIIAIVVRCVRDDAISRPKLAAYLALGCIFAFVSGTGNLRRTLVVIAPLVVAACIALLVYKFPRKRRLALCVGLVTLANIAGSILNRTVVADTFSFNSFSSILWTPFSLERASQAIADILTAIGYTSGLELFAKHALCNLLAIAALVLAIVAIAAQLSAKRDFPIQQRFLALFAVSTFTISGGLYVVSDMVEEPRYWLPALVFLVPVIAAYLRSLNLCFKRKAVLTALLAVCVAVCGLGTYAHFSNNDSTLYERDVVDHVEGMGYTQGYATFWNSDVLTELSDGHIEMWTMNTTKRDENGALLDTPDVSPEIMYAWLQYASHLDERPDHAFILLEKAELDTTDVGRQLKAEKPIYQNEKFVVYDADTYYSKQKPKTSAS